MVLSQFVAAAAAAAATTTAAALDGPQLGGLGGSMVFLENNTGGRDGWNYTAAQEHAEQVRKASHYRMAIMGWGEDQSGPGEDPQEKGEEHKLQKVLSMIKAASPSTLTIAYCGQFDNVVPFYDLQAKILRDKAYHGFFLKDDSGKLWPGHSSGGEAGAIWDFRNASARTYLAQNVAGFFANASGVDGVFFDEGDSLACHYNCKSSNSCRTMPNASAWQAGALEAWKLAAEMMASKGKHAVISSQNSFSKFTPYLMKTKSCPYQEDAAFAIMNSSALARRGWMRFYEYFGAPVSRGQDPVLYCANQIKNAAHEAQDLGIPFVAAASDYPKNQNRLGHPANLTTGPPCCKGGYKKPCPGLPPCGGHTTLEFQLALFLLARGSGNTPSYFEYNHYDWSHWPRWSDAVTSWAEVEPLYSRDYGAALEGLQEQTQNVFTRRYEKVTVRVDCRNQTASYDWK